METAIQKITEEELRERIISVLRSIYDPEIPTSIYELGLIYEIIIAVAESDEDMYDVRIRMTLTAPNCPVAETLPVEVGDRLLSISSINDAKVEVVFEPAWDRSMMTEVALYDLGFL